MTIQIIETWSDLDLNKHIFLNLSNEINQIITPLVKHFGLDTFNYHKTYHDDSYICLTNLPDWKGFYSINKLYQQSIFELPAHNYKKIKSIV